MSWFHAPTQFIKFAVGSHEVLLVLSTSLRFSPGPYYVNPVHRTMVRGRLWIWPFSYRFIIWVCDFKPCTSVHDLNIFNTILLSRTMNNFAALNMLNIGFIQFVLEEERQYNDLVEQQRRRRRPRASWVRNWLKPERRIAVGHYHQLMEELRLDDQVSLYNFLRTGHNGLGIYINRDRTWWLLRSARTKNAMMTEWTVRKRGGWDRN